MGEREKEYYRYQEILAIDQHHMITSHVEYNTKITSAYEHLTTDSPSFRTVATTTSNGVHIAEYELHGKVWCNVGRVVLSAEEFSKITEIMRR